MPILKIILIYLDSSKVSDWGDKEGQHSLRPIY